MHSSSPHADELPIRGLPVSGTSTLPPSQAQDDPNAQREADRDPHSYAPSLFPPLGPAPPLAGYSSPHDSTHAAPTPPQSPPGPQNATHTPLETPAEPTPTRSAIAAALVVPLDQQTEQASAAVPRLLSPTDTPLPLHQSHTDSVSPPADAPVTSVQRPAPTPHANEPAAHPHRPPPEHRDSQNCTDLPNSLHSPALEDSPSAQTQPEPTLPQLSSHAPPAPPPTPQPRVFLHDSSTAALTNDGCEKALDEPPRSQKTTAQYHNEPPRTHAAHTPSPQHQSTPPTPNTDQ